MGDPKWCTEHDTDNLCPECVVQAERRAIRDALRERIDDHPAAAAALREVGSRFEPGGDFEVRD